MKRRLSTAQEDAIRILLGLSAQLARFKDTSAGWENLKGRVILNRVMCRIVGCDPAGMKLDINFPTEYMI